ncbi:MAG: hypothetical protein WC433_07765 [Candidatus Omnitrophota bacterium]
MSKGGIKHHKPNCQCHPCKRKRGEKIIHKIGCNCVACKAKRGEYKGKNNPAFKGDKSITRKKYPCKQLNCNNMVTYQCYFQGSGNCKSCSTKLHLQSLGHNYTFIDGRSTKKYYCKCGNEIDWQTALNGKGMCPSCVGKYLSKLFKGQKRPNTSKTLKEMWKDKEFRERRLRLMRKSISIKPNKPEKLLNKLLQENFPNEYQLNVQGEVMILAGKIPDFVNVNGQKKVIEFFGNYFHSEEWIKKHGCHEDTEKGRIEYFKKIGWDTLVIWEHELSNLEKVKNRIIQFNNK